MAYDKRPEILRLAEVLGIDYQKASKYGLTRLHRMLTAPQRKAEREIEGRLNREMVRQREAEKREQERHLRRLDRTPPKRVDLMMELAEKRRWA